MRIIRVARTLADLDGVDAVKRRHIAEAVSFRRRDGGNPNRPGPVKENPAQTSAFSANSGQPVENTGSFSVPPPR